MLEWIHKNIIVKIDLPVILITFIIISILLSDKREGFKEGFNLGNAIKNEAKKLENAIKKGLAEFAKKLKEISPSKIAEKLRKPFDSLGDIFKKGINAAKSGFEKIGKSFDSPIKNIFSKIRKILMGYVEILEGIGATFFGVSAGMWLGFKSTTALITYASEYFITNLLCGLKFLVFLPACAFFYLADLVGQILYFPIQILLGLLYAAGISKIYNYEKYFWKQVRSFDNLIFKTSGFYLTRWPKTIRDQCYNCKRLKFRVLRSKADEIGIYNDKVVYKKTVGGYNKLMKGINNMVNTFRSLF